MVAAVDDRDRDRDREDLNRDDDQVDEESHAVETLDKEEVDLDRDKAVDPDAVMVMGTVIVMDRDRDRIMVVDKVVHPAMEAVTDRDKEAAVMGMVRVVDPDTATVMEPEVDKEIVMEVVTAKGVAMARDHHRIHALGYRHEQESWMKMNKEEKSDVIERCRAKTMSYPRFTHSSAAFHSILSLQPLIPSSLSFPQSPRPAVSVSTSISISIFISTST